VKHLLIILSLLILCSPLFGQTEENDILFHREENGKYGWYESGNEYNDRKYVGEIENGEPNGQGTEISPDGGKYEGEWKDGEKHGQGIYTWPDGDIYEGEYKDGEKHGQGTYTWSDGDIYEGKYKDGKRHGQGTYSWSGGKKYEGEYKDGEIDGKGTQTFSDGVKWTGEFRNNKRWDITIYNKNSNIIGRFVNGTEYDKFGNIIGSGWME